MAKQTPLQIVTDQFGGRKALVDKIMKLVDTDSDTRSRLMGTTNKKLLRIHEVAVEVHDRFGGRKQLIDAIAGLQFPKGKPNDGWRQSVSDHTDKRLLDLHRTLASKARAASTS